MPIQFRDDAGHFGSIADLLEIVAHDAVTLISRTLPADDIDISFVPSKRVIPHLGHTGHSPNGFEITVNVDADNDNLLPKLETSLPRMLAHEIHHCHRHRGPGYGTTLGEAIVSEGLADHFVLEIFGGDPDAWSVALDSKAIDQWLVEARKEFAAGLYDHDAWFFGRDPSRGIPLWAGYSLGFHLVEQYIAAHHGAKPSALVDIPANVILAIQPTL